MTSVTPQPGTLLDKDHTKGRGITLSPLALRTGRDVGFPGRKSQVCGFGPCSASSSQKSGSFRSKDFSLSQRRLLRGQGGLDTKLASSGGCEFSAAGRVQGDTGRSPGKDATEGTWGPAGKSRRLPSPPPEETLCHWGSRVGSLVRSWPEPLVGLCSGLFPFAAGFFQWKLPPGRSLCRTPGVCSAGLESGWEEPSGCWSHPAAPPGSSILVAGLCPRTSAWTGATRTLPAFPKGCARP